MRILTLRIFLFNYMGHRYTRTPADKAEQKRRSDKNKLKPAKLRKFASEKVKARKLLVKEAKRQKFLKK